MIMANHGGAPEYHGPTQVQGKKKSRTVWWVLGVLLFGGLLCGVGAVVLNSEPSVQRFTSEPGASVSTQPPLALPAGPKTFAVGESAEIKDSGNTVVTTVSKTDYKAGQYGGKYLVASVTIENKSGNEVIDYNVYSWRFKGTDNVVYQAAIMLGENQALSSGQLPVGQKVVGNVAFEVAEDKVKGGQLEYGMFTTLAYWKVA